MGAERAREFWENNRYLLIALAACGGLLVLGYFNRGGETPEDAASGGAVVAVNDDTRQAELKQILKEASNRPPAPPVPTEQDTARADINQYLDEFEKDRSAPDAPARLLASANLYATKLGNFEQACRLYERLLQEYPTWERINSVYPLLVSAYEHAGELQNRLDLLYKMQQLFAEEDALHQYATEQLGRMPQVVPHSESAPAPEPAPPAPATEARAEAPPTEPPAPAQ